ncbi:hypothetical protein HBI56_006880 [Parastagonospora nodorum]|nr:hypothetical protein HBH52_038750 [Parastagonospora nodorum]KAH4005587.1 hypothetical protein HBI10_031800 [Parastagonospora nodorum]KAH4033182.1 hypothetical protein HBI13_007300 [Parastagonospora nodorum]KAH4041986.1 hypothetical protein HBI09_007190 [Parastagonospora nodorum]KAH4060844.1 hypothetical protein HBH49_007370 [Parastagonospora nodorum]
MRITSRMKYFPKQEFPSSTHFRMLGLKRNAHCQMNGRTSQAQTINTALLASLLLLCIGSIPARVLQPEKGADARCRLITHPVDFCA